MIDRNVVACIPLEFFVFQSHTSEFFNARSNFSRKKSWKLQSNDEISTVSQV